MTEPTPALPTTRRSFLVRTGIAVFAAVPVLRTLAAPKGASAANPDSPTCACTRPYIRGCDGCYVITDWKDCYTGEFCYTTYDWNPGFCGC